MKVKKIAAEFYKILEKRSLGRRGEDDGREW